jgi:hypothetical protein
MIGPRRTLARAMYAKTAAAGVSVFFLRTLRRLFRGIWRARYSRGMDFASKISGFE